MSSPKFQTSLAACTMSSDAIFRPKRLMKPRLARAFMAGHDVAPVVAIFGPIDILLKVVTCFIDHERYFSLVRDDLGWMVGFVVATS